MSDPQAKPKGERLCQCGHTFSEHALPWHVTPACSCTVLTLDFKPQPARSEGRFTREQLHGLICTKHGGSSPFNVLDRHPLICNLARAVRAALAEIDRLRVDVVSEQQRAADWEDQYKYQRGLVEQARAGRDALKAENKFLGEATARINTIAAELNAENERLKAEKDAWKQRAQTFQRSHAALFDKLEGTPCEQIRHKQEVDALRALVAEKDEALKSIAATLRLPGDLMNQPYAKLAALIIEALDEARAALAKGKQ